MFSKITLFRTLLSSEKHKLFSKCYSKKTVNLSEPAVQSYLKYLILEHENLYSKPQRTQEESKRLVAIRPIVNVLEQRIALFDSIESLKELNKAEKDEEITKMIKEEAAVYLKRITDIDADLQRALIEPGFTTGGVLLEVTAGAGGQEAMLFARELFDMYQSYANYKNWQIDIASIEGSDLGGIRKGSLLVNGFGVPELMKIEAGVHRVQRIPSTERGGRIHTSTVSVAVLPQPTEVEVNIAERDLVVETKRASGAGGQHVNTTDSAVRMVHVPTGTVVECQEGRSQIKNKQIALQKLRALLLEKQLEEQSLKIQSERKSQIGSSNRNEKIRTYNYPQDRVTEHRDGGSTIHNLKGFMEGGEALEEMQKDLIHLQKHKMFLKEVEEFVSKNKMETLR